MLHRAQAIFTRSINYHYYKYLWKHAPLDDNIILFEQQCGLTANGNLYYLAKALMNTPQYQSKQIYFALEASAYESIRNEFKKRALKVHLVIKRSREYYRILAQARFIFFDTSLAPEYAKKDGQVLINTWHGTPLKTLGRRTLGEEHIIGNVQRCFFLADYILYPNAFCAQCFPKDYMYHSIAQATPLMFGYPRNAPLLEAATHSGESGQHDSSSPTRSYAYMPTFRTGKGDIKRNNLEEMQSSLAVLDKALGDDEVLYIHPHPVVARTMDYAHYQHIKPFPKGVETYEFLSTCDVLISDYSSVIFDFALTRKKIILYAYDLEDYIKTRGIYIHLDTLPFPIVTNVRDLIDEMRSSKDYDESDFLDTYCSHDTREASDIILHEVLDAPAKKEGLISEEDSPTHHPSSVPRPKNLAFFIEYPPTRQNLLDGIKTARALSGQWQPILLVDDVIVRMNRDIFSELDDALYYFPYKQRRVFDFVELALHALHHAHLINAGRLHKALLNHSSSFEYAQRFPKGAFDEVFLYPSSLHDPLFAEELKHET